MASLVTLARQHKGERRIQHDAVAAQGATKRSSCRQRPQLIACQSYSVVRGSQNWCSRAIAYRKEETRGGREGNDAALMIDNHGTLCSRCADRRLVLLLGVVVPGSALECQKQLWWWRLTLENKGFPAHCYKLVVPERRRHPLEARWSLKSASPASSVPSQVVWGRGMATENNFGVCCNKKLLKIIFVFQEDDDPAARRSYYDQSDLSGRLGSGNGYRK